MKKLNILITAGPTQEYIDPVRFISNPSTGTIGYEIAKQAVKKGHSVVLVSGPTYLKPPKGLKRFVLSVSARDMQGEVKKYFPFSDVLIMSAAVSDYRIKKPFRSKIKRNKTNILKLELIRNPDIIKKIQNSKFKNQKLLIGFALETEDIEKYAKEKLIQKRLDMIIANKVNDKPFGNNLTKLLILTRNGEKTWLYGTKKNFSKILLNKIEKMWFIKRKEGCSKLGFLKN